MPWGHGGKDGRPPRKYITSDGLQPNSHGLQPTTSCSSKFLHDGWVRGLRNLAVRATRGGDFAHDLYVGRFTLGSRCHLSGMFGTRRECQQETEFR